MTEARRRIEAASKHAATLGHHLSGGPRGWVWEEGEPWALCANCGGLGQIREDGSYYGPALTDACTGVQGGYAR